MLSPTTPASIAQATPQTLALAGCWTARGLGDIERRIVALTRAEGLAITIDCASMEAMDTAGAGVLQTWLSKLREGGEAVDLQGLAPAFDRILQRLTEQIADLSKHPVQTGKGAPSVFERAGRGAVDAGLQLVGLLSFVGEIAVTFAASVAQPKRIRWRSILFNIRSAGFDALPIVGMLSFLLGIVVAYQGAAQLKLYGANIFVADLVGLSMLREFAPLMTAIIIAGRSGSAYAAQIGTMAVTEEIDAMRTLGISPQELLVLPKIVALVIVLPLLTVFADVMGVLGGMIMARSQLGVSFVEFGDRFAKAVSVTSYLVGLSKAPVFAVIIAVVGCFQGFRTHGGADSVGRQTTRSVVQSIFLVIVADALFSIAFSVLDL